MGRVLTAAVVLVTGVACLALGFLLGWFLSNQTDTDSQVTSSDHTTDTETEAAWTHDIVREKLIHEIKAENIKENLRLVTSGPRMAGTSKGRQHARYIEKTWKEQGLDSAGIDTYHVLLSLPADSSRPNKVEIIDQEGQALYTSPAFETVAGRQDHSNPPYNPYSKPGSVEGDLVYVNYGREEDYDLLWNNYSLTVQGKIVLARYGLWMSPAATVKTAASHGAAGLILYPDPYMETAEGEGVYPDSQWLPGAAVRRASVLQKWGDPLTPGYPATEFARSVPLEEAHKSLSPIPVHTVGYDAVAQLFDSMANFTPSVPDHFVWKDWRQEGGRNQNISDTAFNYTMRLGGNMKQGRRVKLTVTSRLKKKSIHNVCGTLRGAVEPDRYVLLGGHRDAWAEGAVDPGGGVAVLLEVTRAFGALRMLGWQPRRTMIFCSWDAEEFGLLGSTEFVEDKFQMLRDKAIAYINLDIVVMGTDTLEVMSSPLLNGLIFDTLKLIPHPTSPSVYDSWREYLFNTTEGQLYPSIGRLQPISDFTPFYFSAGVSSMNIFYTNPTQGYPAYHTGCDTFRYVTEFIDPSFQYHQVIGHVMAELTRSLADSDVLPLNAMDYANYVRDSLLIFQRSRVYLDKLKWFKGIEGQQLLEQLEDSVFSFYYAAQTFHEELQSIIGTDDALLLRSYNDKLMLLERSFIDINWHREEPMYRHVLFSPVQNGCSWFYAGPGINDALCHPDVKSFIEDDVMPEEGYSLLQREVAVVCRSLDSATEMLVV